MATIDTTKYDAQVANAASQVKISSTVFKNFIANVKDVVDQNSPEGRYAADDGSTDAYAITLDPAPTTYVTGMIYRFKANTANTGACTLNVNTLGAKTIKKNASEDMETGDILADQLVTVEYDGTNMQVISVTSELKTHKAEFATLQGATTSLFRQALINPNFDIWQRGTSFNPASSGGTYTADRWVIDPCAATTNYTVTREDGTGVDGSRYCLRYARDSGSTDVNNRVIRQGIETPNAILFRGKKMTLSFYARCGANYSPTDNALSVLIQTGTGTDESPTLYTGSATAATDTATLTTSWQKFTLTTSAVIADTVNEICVTIFDTPTGTAGAADYYEIEQFQICAGDTAQPFQPRSYSDELALCQRYYEKSYDDSTTPGSTTGVGVISKVVPSNTIAVNQSYGSVEYKVRKRIIPTVTIYGYSGTANTVSNPSTGADLAANSATAELQGQGSFGCRNNTTAQTTVLNSVDYHFTADAEL